MANDAWKPIGRRQRASWMATAEQLGLRHFDGTVNNPPVISGDLEGFDVSVSCTDRTQATPLTRYHISYSSLGDPIRIGRETALARVGVLRRMIDLNDLEIGDAGFDKLALLSLIHI